jgi:hypothetical protein
MSLGRTIIIPAILALSAAGSILAGAMVPTAAAQASGAHVQSADHSVITNVFYHT